MKYLAVMLIAFAALVAAEEEWKPITDSKEMKQIVEDCRKENGIAAEQQEKNNNLFYPNEEEVRDSSLCPALKIGIFSADKGYNLERVIQQLGVFVEMTDEIRGIVADCMDNNEQKSSAADWAFRGEQCISKSKIGKLVKEKHAAKNKEE